MEAVTLGLGGALEAPLELNNNNNNTSTPTRLPYNILNQPTSPEVSLATSDLGLRSTWRAGHELSSDHRPLYISLTLGIPIQHRPNHTFTNYKHAD